LKDKIIFEVVRRDDGNYSAQSLPPHRLMIEAPSLEHIPGGVERVLQSYLGRDPLPEDFELINCEALIGGTSIRLPRPSAVLVKPYAVAKCRGS
jgi:hypothetical protein